MPKEEEYPQGDDEYNLGENKNEDEYDLNDVKGEYNYNTNKEDEYDLDDEKEDEYDLEDKKGEDEFNIESKGLDEFVTTVKQSAAPNFGKPIGGQYNTTIPQQSVNPQIKANDFPLFDNPEPSYTNPPAANAGFGDDFDDLFGDKPVANKPAPASQYTTTYNRPASSSYDQFNSYYATYQQPSSAQKAYNPYAPQVSNATKAPSPFDKIQSSYSELKPNPAVDNDSWF